MSKGSRVFDSVCCVLALSLNSYFPLLFVYLLGSDGLTHYQWSDRTTGTVVDDFMVFPGDAVLAKVSTGKETDRVYLLKWHGGADRKFMFWMQDKSPEEDEQNCRKFNEYITSPPQESAAGAGGDQAADMMRLLG
jgi:hypothetical protein